MTAYSVVTHNGGSPHTQVVAPALSLQDAAALRDKLVQREMAHGWCVVHWDAKGCWTLARVTGRTVRVLCIGIAECAPQDAQGVFRALVQAGQAS